MKIGLILWLLGIVHDVVRFLERQKWKAEGRSETNAEAKSEHDRRVAEAIAARADADAIGGLHEQTDPFNRDK